MAGKLDALGEGLSWVVHACRAAVRSRRLVRGSGLLVSEDRPVCNVRGVSLTGAGQVLLAQGERESLTVESDENLLPCISTEVRNGTLILDFTKEAMGMRICPTVLNYHLTIVTVTALTLGGVGNIHASSLDVGDLEIRLNGAGDVCIAPLNASKVVVFLGGVGNVDLAGQSAEQKVHISGSGTYHAADLRSGVVDVAVSGMGDATVWATEALHVRISGGGSVKYHGSPDVRYRMGGLGRVISLGGR